MPPQHEEQQQAQQQDNEEQAGIVPRENGGAVPQLFHEAPEGVAKPIDEAADQIPNRHATTLAMPETADAPVSPTRLLQFLVERQAIARTATGRPSGRCRGFGAPGRT